MTYERRTAAGLERRCSDGAEGIAPAVPFTPAAPVAFVARFTPAAPVALLALAAFLGCGSGGGGTKPPTPPTAAELVTEGWASFERGDLASAESSFTRAEELDSRYGPAPHGLAWTFLRRGDLPRADRALERAAADGFDEVDLHAARALIARDLEPVQWTRALGSADVALARAPQYRFDHDPAVDWRDLRLVAAHAAFALQQLPRVRSEILALGAAAPDPASPRYVEELLATLEALSRGRGEKRRPGAR